MPNLNKSIELLDPVYAGKANLNKASLRVELADGMSFVVARNNVLQVRDFCNAWMREFGAFDGAGRAVVDRESGNV